MVDLISFATSLTMTMLLLSSLSAFVTCSHFAYGTISWVYKGPGEVYTLTFESAWRTDFGWYLTPSFVGVTPCLTPGSSCNSIELSGNQEYEYFMSFSSPTTTAKPPNAFPYGTVTSIEPNDWFIAVSTLTITFPSQQPIWNVQYYQCCRLLALQQSNGGVGTLVKARIVLGTSSSRVLASPTATTFPRTLFVMGLPIQYSVPGFSPQGNQLAYSISTTGNSGLATNPPRDATGLPASINTLTGQVTWNAPTCCNGYEYAVQFTITDSVTGAFIVLDELFVLTTTCSAATAGCSLPPVFNPPIPPEYDFYVGQQGKFFITATDVTVGQAIQVQSSPLPTGASLTLLSSTTTPSVSNYVLQWTPALGQAGRSVCFLAFNSQNPPQQSTGSNCANLVIKTTPILVVSCTIRDFNITQPDFSVAAAGGDTNVQIVSSTLTGSGPPTLNTGVKLTTIASPASFAQWWASGLNSQNIGQTSWDMVLASLSSSSNPVFTFDTSLFYPIDNQLGGNQGSSHNRYFTLEAHTYFSYTPGTTFTFQSQDDLWVYINGQLLPNWNLGGVPASGSALRSYVANLDALASSNPNLGLIVDNAAHDHEMRVDFYYAHRSLNNDAAIQMQLTQAFLCNALSNGLVITNQSIGFSSAFSQPAIANTNSFFLLGASAFNTPNAAGVSTLSLLQGGPTSNSGAAWFGVFQTSATSSGVVPRAQNVLHGFEIDFSFVFLGVSEGFALVLQSASASARGSESGGLGYNNIPLSIAIEFDNQQTALFGDQAPYPCPAISGFCASHVSIHTAYNSANSANESPAFNLGSFLGASSAPLYMQFDNGTEHRVRVVYSPPAPSSGSSVGWIKVYMAAGSAPENIQPVAEGQLNSTALAAMWGGAAYIGFTASTSDAAHSDIQITRFAVTLVQPSAAKSSPVTFPSNQVAGVPSSFIVQLQDACGNAISTGGDLVSMSATLTMTSPVLVTNLPIQIADVLNNGQYVISYQPTVTGQYSITVSFKGQQINTSPWSFAVIPGIASASNSNFTLTDLTPAFNLLQPLAIPYNFTGAVRIIARDLYNNLATLSVDPFSVVFAPTLNVSSPAPPDVNRGNGYYITSFESFLAGPSLIYVTLNGQNLPNSPLSLAFLGGPAYAPQCSGSGVGLTQSIAGTTATFVLTLRDVSGNLIQYPGNTGDSACNYLSSACSLTLTSTPSPLPAGVPTRAPGATSPVVSCAWSTQSSPIVYVCSFTATVAGTYTPIVMVNGLLVSLPQLAVVPGSVFGPASTIQYSPVITAGLQVTSLFVQARDMFFNMRATPNEAGGAFVPLFTPQSAVTGVNGNKSPVAVYTTSGQYTIVFTTTIATSAAPPIVSLTLSFNYTLTGSTVQSVALLSSASFTVVAGASSALSRLSSAPASLTASSALPLSSMTTTTVTSIDIYGNIKYQGAAATDFTLLASNAANQAVPQFMSSLSSIGGAVFSLPLAYTVAGVYTVSISVSSSGLSIIGSPFSVTILPAATSTVHCTAFGPGLQSAVYQVPAQFTVQAADAFNNLQLAGAAATNDHFYAVVSPASSTGQSVLVNATSIGAGQYAVNYTYSWTASSFTVTVYRRVVGVSPDLSIGPGVSVIAIPNFSTLYVKLTGGDATSGQVGRVNSFVVTQYLTPSFTTLLPGAITVFVDIYFTPTGASSSSAIHLTGVQVSTGTTNTSSYTVTFTPVLTLPTLAGAWSIAVSHANVIASLSPFVYNIRAGTVSRGSVLALSAAVVAASTPYTVQLQLLDAFNNIAGSIAGSVFATFTGTSAGSGLSLTPFSVLGAYSSTTQSYSFSYIVTVAGSYSISFFINNSTSIASASFIVSAGAVNASTSSVTGDGLSSSYLLSMTAHVPSTFTLTVRDSFSNLVDFTVLGNAMTSALQVSSSLSPSVNAVNLLTTCVYQGLSLFQCQLQNDRAAQVILLITLSSSSSSSSLLIGSLSYRVLISGGPLSPSSSTISVLSPSPAGNAIFCLVNAYDAYGNPFTQGGLSASVRDPKGNTFSAPVTYSSIMSIPVLIPQQLNLTDGAGMYFAVYYGGLSTSVVGTYAFSWQTSSGAVQFIQSSSSSSSLLSWQGGFSVTVVAGAVYAPNTVVPPSIPTSIAGTTGTFSVSLRDVYGNAVNNILSVGSNSSSGSSSSVQFGVEFLIGRISCVNTDADDKRGALATVPQSCANSSQIGCPAVATVGSRVSSSSSSSSFTFTFATRAAGLYTVNMTVNNVVLPCSSLSQMTIVTNAGPIDASQSYVVGVPSTPTVANTKIVLTVFLRDHFGNPILAGSGANISLSSASYPPLSQPASYYTLSASDAVILPNNDGTYSVSVSPRLAGTWLLPLLVNGRPLLCVPASSAPLVSFSVSSSSPSPSPCSLLVVPSEAWLWTIVGSPTARAGTVETMTIQITDAYGNPTTLSSSVNATNAGTLVVSATNDYVTTYSVPNTLTSLGGGLYVFTYFSVWSGNTDISISFSPSPSPVCAGLSTPYLCPSGQCATTPLLCSPFPPKSAVVTVFVNHITCAQDTPNLPFRCLSGVCVANATVCPENLNVPCTNSNLNAIRSSVDGKCYISAALSASTAGVNVGAPICPPPLISCPYTSVCAPSLSSCLSPQPCPQGSGPCPFTVNGAVSSSGVCRPLLPGTQTVDVTQCPAPRVCPLNTVMCPDAQTCVPPNTLCPDPFSRFSASASNSSSSICPSGLSPCWNGVCASLFENCPTPVTCPTDRPLLCQDGSCVQSAAQCPPLYPCASSSSLVFSSGTSFTCWDNSCRSSPSDCPSQVTCPVSWVRCESGQCSPSLSQCPTSQICPASRVRCGDGKCQNNTYFCSSQKTCPSITPVRCGDGTCTTSIYQCAVPALCDPTSRSPATCPDNSCAPSVTLCPTTSSCPFSTPVLCPDGACVSSASLCISHSVPACPSSLPLLCPDGGSCRVQLSDCPSRAFCVDPRRPLRCGDGRCVESVQMCLSGTLLTCPSTKPHRCPYGGCALTADLCSTTITCPPGSIRCNDGSCRLQCDLTSELPSCPSSTPFACPSSVAGVVCVNDVSQCPPYPVCPSSRPVRCLDVTCAASVSACPPLPAAPIAGHVPCADGSWSTNPFFCPTPSMCPSQFPFKCWDDTCRLSPLDCPQAPTCVTPSLAQPYRCATGVCAPSPWDSSCVQPSFMICSSSSSSSLSGPVRCPGTSTGTLVDPNSGAVTAVSCVSDVSQCFTTHAPTEALTCPNLATTTSSTGGFRCRDGSCRYGSGQSILTAVGTVPGVCDDTVPSCPSSLPYACLNGGCARDSTGCPLSSTVGSPCLPGYSWCSALGGMCTLPQLCPLSSSFPCPTGLIRCTDGSCQPVCTCVLQCLDGSCAASQVPADGFQVNTNNLCWSGIISVQPTQPLAVGNVCSPDHPYRCNDGFCALSSSLCPSSPSFHICPSYAPFQCASGSCVIDPSQCPVVPYCPSTSTTMQRCGDGSCRVIGTCPTANTCPLMSTGQRRLRCSNGLCSSDNTTAGCLCTDSSQPGCTVANSCPVNFQRCTSGQCIPISATCSSSSSSSSSAGNQSSTIVIPTNGCPIGSPIKCPDGSCSPSTSQCTLANGCPPSAPIRCTAGANADNSCQASVAQCAAATIAPLPTSSSGTSVVSPYWQCADGSYTKTPSQCKALNGCPLSTPVRCANSTCAQFPASLLGLGSVTVHNACSPTLECSSSQVQCFDGSCASDSSFCPSVPGCSGSTPVQCPLSNECVSSSSQCSAAACPASVPVLCGDGSCISSLSHSCPLSGSLGSGIGGATGNVLIIPGSVVTPMIGGGGGSAQIITTTAPTLAPPSASTSTSTSTSSTSSPSPGTQPRPSSYGVGSTVIGSSISRCSPPLVECFDGSCRQSPALCLAFATALRTTTSSSSSFNSCEVQGLVTCSDGSCMPYASACPIIPACPQDRPVRCLDGSCVQGVDASSCSAAALALSANCNWGSAFTPSSTPRCEDGTCRAVCLPADGCPTYAPVHCSNRECAISASQCIASASSASLAGGFIYAPNLVTPMTATGATPPSVFTTSSMIHQQHEHETRRRRLLTDAVHDRYSYYNVDKISVLAIAPTGSPSITNSSSTVSTSTYNMIYGTPTSSVCYSNCFSSIKASSSSYLLSLGQTTTVPVASDSVASLGYMLVPAGALVTNVTSGVNQLRLTLTAVAENHVRRAENRVWVSRRPDVSGLSYLTFAQTVLSPMVNITFDPLWSLPLPVSLSLVLAVDGTLGEPSSDVCLARLIEFSPPLFAGGYTGWQCVSAVAWRNGTGDARYMLSGPVFDAGIYAIIFSPLKGTPSTSVIAWALNNIGWLILILVGGIGFVFGTLYAITRLSRFRQKYKQEQKEVELQKEEVEEMEQFGGSAGKKDDEVVMKSNPLAVQLSEVQAALDEKAVEERRLTALRLKSESDIRQQHINALKEDRDRMRAELDLLHGHAGVMAAEEAQRGPKRIEDAPTSLQPLSSSGAGADVHHPSTFMYPGEGEGDEGADHHTHLRESVAFNAHAPLSPRRGFTSSMSMSADTSNSFMNSVHSSSSHSLMDVDAKPKKKQID